MEKFIDLDGSFNFVGKDALIEIRKSGIHRKQVGLIIDIEPLKGPNTSKWEIISNNKIIGVVTSAVYSPRLKSNIALAMVKKEFSDIGTSLKVNIDNNLVNANIVLKPFFDPNKSIAKDKTNIFYNSFYIKEAL